MDLGPPAAAHLNQAAGGEPRVTAEGSEQREEEEGEVDEEEQEEEEEQREEKGEMD